MKSNCFYDVFLCCFFMILCISFQALMNVSSLFDRFLLLVSISNFGLMQLSRIVTQRVTESKVKSPSDCRFYLLIKFVPRQVIKTQCSWNFWGLNGEKIYVMKSSYFPRTRSPSLFFQYIIMSGHFKPFKMPNRTPLYLQHEKQTA